MPYCRTPCPNFVIYKIEFWQVKSSFAAIVTVGFKIVSTLEYWTYYFRSMHEFRAGWRSWGTLPYRGKTSDLYIKIITNLFAVAVIERLNIIFVMISFHFRIIYHIVYTSFLPQKIDTFLLKVQLWAAGEKIQKSNRQFKIVCSSDTGGCGGGFLLRI